MTNEQDTKKEPTPESQNNCEDLTPENSSLDFLPSPDFSTFVLSLSSSALVYMGEVPDPGSQKKTIDLPLAKHTIDTLCLLKTKTQGNLTPEETRLLDDLLFDLRMKFVQRSQ